MSDGLDKFTGLSESEKQTLMQKAGYTESKADLIFYKVIEYKENKLSIWIDYSNDEPEVDSVPSIGETRLHTIPSVKAILLAASDCLDVLDWNPDEEVEVENTSGGKEIVEPVNKALDVQPEATSMRETDKQGQEKQQEQENQEEQEEEEEAEAESGEMEELAWPEDEDILARHLENVGFDSTRKDGLFVLDLETGDDDAIFVDFRDSTHGRAYPHSKCSSDVEVDNVPEYMAFRKLQKGQAVYDEDDPYTVTLKKDGGKKPLRLPNKKHKEKSGGSESSGRQKSRAKKTGHGLSITYNDETVEIPEENVANLHGKDFPETDGILKVANEQGWIKRLNTVMSQHPQVILPEGANIQEYSDLGDMETYGAIAKAIVEREDGAVFTENGTAHPYNLKPSFYANICEMAATRALGRALRRAFGITTVAEEMEGKDGD